MKYIAVQLFSGNPSLRRLRTELLTIGRDRDATRSNVVNETVFEQIWTYRRCEITFAVKRLIH